MHIHMIMINYEIQRICYIEFLYAKFLYSTYLPIYEYIVFSN